MAYKYNPFSKKIESYCISVSVQLISIEWINKQEELYNYKRMFIVHAEEKKLMLQFERDFANQLLWGQSSMKFKL